VKVARGALTALGLLAVFSAGLVTGRLVEFGEKGPTPEDREIRAGLQGYTNPLLECEIANERLSRPLRPFTSGLTELVATLKRDRGATEVAVYYRDLNNGPWVGLREKQRYVPASLSKVPIVIACFRQAEADPGFLARKIVYEGLAEERLPGFLNPESNLQPGKTYSVDELILRIARFSDNAAAKLLSQAIPPGLLRRVYYDLGVEAQRLDSREFALSPKEYGAFFRVLYNASYLSRRYSEQALRYFDQSTFELGLVAGVPDGTAVSHKFGVWENRPAGSGPSLQLHDCGIVYHPERPYLLCVMTTGENYVRMAGVIAAVSRFVYEEVDGSLKPSGASELPGDPPDGP